MWHKNNAKLQIIYYTITSKHQVFGNEMRELFFHGKIDYLLANVLILKKTKSNKSILNIFIMGHFRYLFMALVVSLLFPAANAGAQALSNGFAHEAIYYKAETKDGRSSSSTFVYDKKYFNTFATELDRLTPYDVVKGVVVTYVAMQGNDINIYATCDRVAAFRLNLFGNQIAENAKKEIAQDLYDIFDELGTDDLGNTVVDKMVQLGINVKYKFFTQDQRSPLMTITLSGQYIERVGEGREYLHNSY